MTVFNANIVLRDAFGRKTRKMYQTEDITDIDVGAEFLTAYNETGLLLADLQAVTQAEVLSYTVQAKVAVTDSPGVGANIDEGMTLVTEKADSESAILKVPAPDLSLINPDGTVDTTAAAVINYHNNFTTAGKFTVSDGEKAVVLLSGRLDR